MVLPGHKSALVLIVSCPVKDTCPHRVKWPRRCCVEFVVTAVPASTTDRFAATDVPVSSSGASGRGHCTRASVSSGSIWLFEFEIRCQIRTLFNRFTQQI